MALASCFVEALDHVEASFNAGRINMNQRAAARNGIFAEASAEQGLFISQVERDLMLRKQQQQALRVAQSNAVEAYEAELASAQQNLQASS